MYRIVDDNTFIVSGNAILDDMFERLDIKKMDEDDDALNVNSWVTDTFERIPAEGEYFEYGDYTVTVTKVNFRRVVEVQIHHNRRKRTARLANTENKEQMDKIQGRDIRF
jgi:CBS domain containing-hemolysin-like protein